MYAVPIYEPWDAPPPSDEEVRALYEAWIQVREAHIDLAQQKPLTFGMVNPETGEFNLFSYMANYDNGLPAVFILRGLDAIEHVARRGLSEDVARHVAETAVFNLVWVKPNGVSDEDRKRLEARGFTFGEGEKWPYIVSSRPGFVVRFPTAQEVRFITLALQKFIEFFPDLERFREEWREDHAWPILIPEDRENDTWNIVDDIKFTPSPPLKYALPKKLLRRAKALPRTPESFTVYLEWVPDVVVEREDGSEAYAYVLVTMESLFMNAVQFTTMYVEKSLDDIYQRVPQTVLEHLIAIGKCPSVLHTAQEEISYALQKLEKPLDLQVTQGDLPPLMERVLEEIRLQLKQLE